MEVYCIVTFCLLCPNFKKVLRNLKGGQTKAMQWTWSEQADDTDTAAILMCTNFFWIKIVFVKLKYFYLRYLSVKGNFDWGKGLWPCLRHQFGYLGPILGFMLTCVSMLDKSCVFVSLSAESQYEPTVLVDEGCSRWWFSWIWLQ